MCMMETETLRILEKMEKSKKTYKTLSYFSNPLVVRTHKTTPFFKNISDCNEQNHI